MSSDNPVVTMLSGAFDPPLFMKLIRKIGHGAALGLRYQAHGEDWAELVLPANTRLIGNADMVASGPIIALMDMATSMAIWIERKRFVPQATLDMRLDTLRSATPGIDIVGYGECTRLKGSLAYARGIAHQGDPGDPIAHVTATFMATS